MYLVSFVTSGQEITHIKKTITPEIDIRDIAVDYVIKQDGARMTNFWMENGDASKCRNGTLLNKVSANCIEVYIKEDKYIKSWFGVTNQPQLTKIGFYSYALYEDTHAPPVKSTLPKAKVQNVDFVSALKANKKFLAAANRFNETKPLSLE